MKVQSGKDAKHINPPLQRISNESDKEPGYPSHLPCRQCDPKKCTEEKWHALSLPAFMTGYQDFPDQDFAGPQVKKPFHRDDLKKGLSCRLLLGRS